MKKLKVVCLMLVCLFITFTFAGCWDGIEIAKLFIVTSIAVDASEENEDEFILSVEISKPSKPSQSSGSSGSQSGADDSFFVLKTNAKNFMNGMTFLNLHSSRTLLLQHSQTLLISKELAQKGILKFIDYFMREGRVRLETTLLIVDGKAIDVLKAKTVQEKTPSNYILGMMDDLEKISKDNRTRIFKFAKNLINENSSTLVPIIKLTDSEKENKKDIKFTSLGIFKGDKLVGELYGEDAFGLIMARGSVYDGSFSIKADDGSANLSINEIHSKFNQQLTQDNKLEMSLELKASLQIVELNGFKDLNVHQLSERLSDLVKIKIRDLVLKGFNYVKELKADVYDTSGKIYQTNPKQYEKVKKDWDEIFANSNLKLKIKVEIPNYGKIINNIQMERESRSGSR